MKRVKIFTYAFIDDKVLVCEGYAFQDSNDLLIKFTPLQNLPNDLNDIFHDLQAYIEGVPFDSGVYRHKDGSADKKLDAVSYLYLKERDDTRAINIFSINLGARITYYELAIKHVMNDRTRLDGATIEFITGDNNEKERT